MWDVEVEGTTVVSFDRLASSMRGSEELLASLLMSDIMRLAHSVAAALKVAVVVKDSCSKT